MLFHVNFSISNEHKFSILLLTRELLKEFLFSKYVNMQAELNSNSVLIAKLCGGSLSKNEVQEVEWG